MSNEYGVKKREFIHSHAFCLVPYVNDDDDAEIVWNSRDGGIASALRGTSGRVVYPMLTATAIRSRYYVPPIGSIILVEPEFNQVLRRMRELIDASWEEGASPGRNHHLFSRLGREGAARFMAQARIENEDGHPIVVDEAIHDHFRRRAASRVIGRSNIPSEVLAESCTPNAGKDPTEITSNWWRMGERKTCRVPIIRPWLAALGPGAAWLGAACNKIAATPLLSSIA